MARKKGVKKQPAADEAVAEAVATTVPTEASPAKEQPPSSKKKGKSKKRKQPAAAAAEAVETTTEPAGAPASPEVAAAIEPPASKKKRKKKKKKQSTDKTDGASEENVERAASPPPSPVGAAPAAPASEPDLLTEIDAVSSEEDGDGDGDGGDDGDGDGDDDEGDGDAEASALRDAIRGGKFDSLLAIPGKKEKGKAEVEADADAESEEQPPSLTDEAEAPALVEVEASLDDGGDDMDGVEVESEAGAEATTPSQEEIEDVADGNRSDDDDDDRRPPLPPAHVALATALRSVNRNLPFAETLAVIAPTPLPFASAKKRKRAVKQQIEEDDDDSDASVHFEDDDEDEGEDVHDDLKREVAFHDLALEAATIARQQCQGSNVPFVRPDDYFAEMVKTDTHMAMVKDRLIFESKKMESVERRRSEKEQTYAAKERRASRNDEKAKMKKDHFKQVDEWKKDAERNRGGLGGKLRDGDDEKQLGRMGAGRDGTGGGNNRKREAANKKYGFGGKTGRFKGEDKRSLNDASGFNPKGNFGGVGSKSAPAKGKGGGNNTKRPGKRMREARSRQGNRNKS